MFVNASNAIGMIFVEFTHNISGSIFLSLLAINFLILMFFIMFRVPVLLSLVLSLPLTLSFMAYSSEYLAIGGAIVIYLGFMFGINYFTNL
jgi:hypothetical protein